MVWSKAWKQSFKVGDEVSILLPVQGQPLQARYSGPFTIEKKINDVDYVVYTPERCKEKRSCHVNMLKLYQERKSDEVMFSHIAVCPVFAEANHDIVGDAPKHSNSEAFQNLQRKLSHLTLEEQSDMENLLFEFRHLFPDMPSCTTWIFHDVEVGSTRPCRQHPYRINPIKLQYLWKEIEYMLTNKIIEPSCSKWSNPCVLVSKTDGTYGFCTDFRKLNAIKRSDSYPLPRMEDCIDCVEKQVMWPHWIS